MSHNIGLYIRVSTEEQAMKVEGSLESQKHRLLGFVDIKNMQNSGWGKVVQSYIDDGYSAKDTNRPALQRLLKDLKLGRINMVLVVDLSRLSRSIRDFCGLLDYFTETKSKFLSLKEQFDTTTAAGEMMLFNMINLAQFERRQISERVTMNFHSRALRGLRNGSSPTIGFKVDPTNKSVLQINSDEVEYVKRIFNLYLSEGSLSRTAAQLREAGIPSRANDEKSDRHSSKIWNIQNVSNVLRNYQYAGLREVNKTNRQLNQEELPLHQKYQVVKAAWPAIISEATFFTVQKMLDDNYALERERLSGSKKRTFLATGISSCLECGRPLVGSTGHGKVREIRYYIHRPIEGKPVTCSVKRYRADEVEHAITNHLVKVVEREGYLDGIEKTLREIQKSNADGGAGHKKNLQRAIAQFDLDIKSLIKIQIRTEDEDLKELYSTQLKDLKDERQAALEQMEVVDETTVEMPTPSEMRNSIQENLKKFKKAWAKATPSLQKNLIRAVIQRLVLHADGIDIFYHSDKAEILEIQSNEKTGSAGNAPVDLASARKAKADRHAVSVSGLSGFDHYKKVRGWYSLKIGCGGRI